MSTFAQKLKKSDLADKFSLIVALIVIIVLFSFFNKNYFSARNFLNILVACSLMGFVAIGETKLIIANLIDLSAGSVAAFCGVFAAVLSRNGFDPCGVLLLAVLMGCFAGLINSFLINYLNLQPFIATLAMMSIARGFAYIICNGRAVAITDKRLISFGTLRLFGQIPLPVVVLLITYLISGYILSRTFFGRSVYVMGGNAYAARLSGLNPKMITMKLYLLTGGLSGLAGALLAARMNSGQPSACEGLEFDAVTAAILGGAAFTGGVGTILGTFIGMLILQCFNTGLVMLNVQIFWQNVAKGALLIVALAFDYYRKNERNKNLLKESMRTESVVANNLGA